MAKKKTPIKAEEAQEQTDLRAFAAADDAAVVAEPVAEPVAVPEPTPVVPVDESVTLTTARPAPGEYRVLVALVDDHGHAKVAEFTIGPLAYQGLTERHSWDQYFYPAVLKVTRG